jgi:hypothetical protein
MFYAGRDRFKSAATRTRKPKGGNMRATVIRVSIMYADLATAIAERMTSPPAQAALHMARFVGRTKAPT